MTRIKYATEYIFYRPLITDGGTDFQSNPTIAAGDFSVSTDGSAFSSLDTLPTVTPTAQRQVKMTLSVAETTGKSVTVFARDLNGSEWESGHWEFDTEGHASAQFPASDPTGARAITINVQDENTDPLVGEYVSIRNQGDTATLWVVGPSDASGDIAISIADGTYQLRTTIPGYIADSVPQEMVVTTDATVNLTGTLSSPSAAAQADGCVVFGTLRNASGAVEVGATITAECQVATPQKDDSDNVLTSTQVSTTTNASGYFELELIQGALVTFKIISAGINTETAGFTVPASASYDISNEIA